MAAAALLRYLVVLLPLVVSCLGMPVQPSSAPRTVDGITAIYNFGDSISDTGNFIREGAVGLMKLSGKLPYGSAIGGPTGRCSDGYLMIDFLAKDLGLPLLSPYLDKAADFTHGVNFAVTGATALDTATLVSAGINMTHTNSSLGVQLQWFKDFMASTTKTPSEAREKLASSLVLVGEIGGNDYNYAFAMNSPRPNGGFFENVAQMITGAVESLLLVPQVVGSITGAAKELLDMGATRVVIPGNFPLGCLPSYLKAVNETDRAAYDGRGCLIVLNAFAQTHNTLLQKSILELRRQYPSATISYGNYFSAYEQLLSGASKTGFDAAATTKACCGAGGGPYNFDIDRICGSPGTAVCARPDEYLSWDGIHLTQHAYKVMTELLYHGGLASPPPVNFPSV